MRAIDINMQVLSVVKTMYIAKSQIRILIADKYHPQTLQIEKNLNRLGQFQIGTVSSYEELIQLTQPRALTFDLLIIDSALTQDKEIEVASYCLSNTRIKHAFIYGNEHLILHGGNVAERFGMLMMAKHADLSTLRRILRALLGDITNQ